ncbi:MAG: extracellular solute-binding protein [Deltaproteobacteria bacterium]|nr:MAG: extracellular solute-binding protein [Deltaproteobacteria bacterium]
MKHRLFFISIAAIFSFVSISGAFTRELVVYSARKEHLIKPIFDLYTKKTGVKIKYLTGKAGVLLERLKAEGPNTPADLLITVDAGNLWHAAEEGLLSPVTTDTLLTNIPSHLRDSQNHWFGLSVRARTIIYNTKKVDVSELSTYEALANPRWRDRLILRTSKKVYNQSLVASLIVDHGEAKTEKIVRGWVANLAAPPFSNDTKVMEAVAAGLGEVGIVNTYYYGRLMKKIPTLPLTLFWPNQNGTGVHVNVSGAGVTTHAKHREDAVRLLEWLSTEEPQGLFAGANMEYPANPTVKVDSVVAGWGEFKPNHINVAEYGKYQAAAIRLMDRAGYR